MTHMSNQASMSFNIDSILYLPDYLNDIGHMTSPDLDCCQSKMINYTGQFILIVSICYQPSILSWKFTFILCYMSRTVCFCMYLHIILYSIYAIDTAYACLLNDYNQYFSSPESTREDWFTVILSKLTCDFRKLPPEHDIYPKYCFKECCYIDGHWRIDFMNGCPICSRKILKK